ncbi:hypothetical protein BZA05DRAFT_433907 [Tricharina praecox]|uniref:uncharacterized protein n=1 Tax=Tricharina praecox TaxID=43433 RepID=UPI00221EFF95|nr:uncharacterized protein BZA05DRAFT_433907 [Tricharina praecox]KAI5856273.1 hypothetical protein BZA05DRAFT_433907 [Tricharina praecox]
MGGEEEEDEDAEEAEEAEEEEEEEEEPQVRGNQLRRGNPGMQKKKGEVLPTVPVVPVCRRQGTSIRSLYELMVSEYIRGGHLSSSDTWRPTAVAEYPDVSSSSSTTKKPPESSECCKPGLSHVPDIAYPSVSSAHPPHGIDSAGMWPSITLALQSPCPVPSPPLRLGRQQSSLESATLPRTRRESPDPNELTGLGEAAELQPRRVITMCTPITFPGLHCPVKFKFDSRFLTVTLDTLLCHPPAPLRPPMRRE